MEIQYGSTRFVLLIGDKAYKFGRVRFLRVLGWIFMISISRKHKDQFLSRYGNFVATSILSYLLTGLNSNRIEYEYSQSHTEDCRIIPTTRTLFNGWIVVQERGSPISMDELRTENPFDPNTSSRLVELKKVEQFCRYKRKIVLVDYGNRSTCEVLHAYSIQPVLETR